MNEEKLNELNRRYSLAEVSKVTTNFYNRVYEYIDFIKNDKYLSDILEKDDNEYHEYDRKKIQTLPKRLPGESWREFDKKEFLHIQDGDSSFLSKYFFELDWWIYDPLHIYYTEDFSKYVNNEQINEEINCILHGEKNKAKERYIKNFPNWKKWLEKFHTLLLKRIKENPAKEPIFKLNKDGSFKYLNKTGRFNTSTREYKVIELLYKSKNKVLTYKEIIESVYKKSESSVSKRELSDQIKKIKVRLGILPRKKDSLKDIIINHKNLGYSLNFLEEK